MELKNKVRTFCHKVLPLVYDGSLSYYEVVCKLAEILSDTDITVSEIQQKLEHVITEENGYTKEQINNLFFNRSEVTKIADKLRDEIGKKLDVPEDAPVVGKVLRVKSVNEDGSFVVEWGDAGVGDAVRYVPQELTDVQKAIAKSNIDASRITDVVLTRTWTRTQFNALAVQGRSENWYVPPEDARKLIIGDIFTLYASLSDCYGMKAYMLIQVTNIEEHISDYWLVTGTTLLACTQSYIAEVQADGVTVVTGGVANVPLASSTVSGVLRTGNGLSVDLANKNAYCNKYTLEQYNNGNDFRFIGKGTLENIFNAKVEAFNDSKVWELIEAVTFENDTQSYTFNLPKEYRHVYITVYVKGSTQAVTTVLATFKSITGATVTQSSLISIVNTADRWGSVGSIRLFNKNVPFAINPTQSAGRINTMLAMPFWDSITRSGDAKIKSVTINALTPTVFMPKGSTITVYGVE